MGDDVSEHLPVAAWGHLPTSLGRVKHDRLIAGSALGGDAVLLLKRVPEEVTLPTFLRTLCAVLGQRALATLVSLAARLGLTTPILLPWRGLG
jgi:hypothetical protein